MKKIRIIAVLLFIVLCGNIFTPAFAMTPAAESSVVIQSGSGESPVREISHPSAYNALFQEDQKNGTTMNSNSILGDDRDSVSYTYELKYLAAKNQYTATMKIEFLIQNETYYTEVNGVVDQIAFGQDNIFITGPLYGKLSKIDDCEVIVGFNQILGQDKLSFYITFYHNDQQVMIRCGQDIFTTNQLNESCK